MAPILSISTSRVTDQKPDPEGLSPGRLRLPQDGLSSTKNHRVLGTVPVVLGRTSSLGAERGVRPGWKGERAPHRPGRQHCTRSYTLGQELGARKARPTRSWAEKRFKKTRTVPRELTWHPTACHSCRRAPTFTPTASRPCTPPTRTQKGRASPQAPSSWGPLRALRTWNHSSAEPRAQEYQDPDVF